ncbi:MAG: EGF domain-containing protein, partial [Myxococcota bacterium]|nr:EGF domain-containing protein [Myxococcota bacterium]
NACGPDGTCTNTVGGFTCACNTGFSWDGTTCVDVDECSTGADNCSPDATCTNLWGGFTCQCRVGFAGTGTSCSDVDECATGANACAPGATCTNTAGGFYCEVPSASSVVPIDLCDPSPVGIFPNTSRSPKAVWVRGGQLGSTGNKRTIVEWDPVPGADNYWVESTLHRHKEGYVDRDLPLGNDMDHRNALQSGFEFDANNPRWKDAVYYHSGLSDGQEVTVKVRATQEGPGGGETQLHSYPEYRFRLGGEYVVDKPVMWGRAGNQEATLEWCDLEKADSYELVYGSSPTQLTEIASVGKTADASPVGHTVTGLNNQQTKYFVLYPLRNGVRGQPSECLEITPTGGSGPADLDVSIHAITFNQATSITLWPLDAGAPSVDRIAGKPGVLRVFLKHNLPDSPKVGVQLNLFDGEQLLTSLRRTVVLRDAAHEDADSSDFPVLFELLDPAWLVEGASFSVEVDPEDEITETDEDNNRHPTGDETSAFGFVEAPGLKIKLIGTRSSHGESRAITEGVKNQIKQAFLDMYPVKEVSVEVADDGAGTPFVLSLDGFDVDDSLGESSGGQLQGPLRAVLDYRNTDINGDSAKMKVFYYALVKKGENSEGTSTGGLAVLNPLGKSYAPLLVGIGNDDADTMIGTMLHEVGHNHSAKHVQAVDDPTNACLQTSNSDITYPYNNYDENGASQTEYGRIGKTGYIASQERLVNKNYYNDVMSYCANRSWISDHTYRIFRLFS